MRLIVSITRLVFRLGQYIFILLLLMALLWTLSQLVDLNRDQLHASSTIEDRRPAYRATATALAVDENNAQLKGGARIVLMQDVFATSTPDLRTPSPEAATVKFEGTPEPIDLPNLVMPANPAPGLVLSGTAVPARVPAIRRDYDLVNIILLGADDELTDDNFVRTDTMIIVSLNMETGAVSMVNLPRDLYVYIPSGRMGRLNIAYGIGENIGWNPDGGFGLLRQTIFYNFGINVHYFARVNFSGFKAIIDRLGGVDIAVDCTYRDLYPVTRTNGGAAEDTKYEWRTLNVGYYTFDGFDALWYARTRKYTDDLDRGRRQQQLLRAMWRKARGNGLITTLPAIWNEITEVVETNLPFSAMFSLLPHLVDLDLDNIQNLTFRRNYHSKNWQTPLRESVLLPQAEPIADLMLDLYTPPSENQTVVAGPSIGVYNGSGIEYWDLIASERLRWGGFNAIALGPVPSDETIPSSQLVDYIAASKGSIVQGITKALNMTRKQVETQADPEREFDYEVIIGRDYKSCTFGVLPIDG